MILGLEAGDIQPALAGSTCRITHRGKPEYLFHSIDITVQLYNALPVYSASVLLHNVARYAVCVSNQGFYAYLRIKEFNLDQFILLVQS